MDSSRSELFFAGVLLSAAFTVVFTPVLGIIDVLKWFVVTVLELIVEGITMLAGWFVIETIELVLFFPPPTDIPELTSLYWGVTFPLFWGLLTVIGLGFFGLMQLFPASDKADTDKFMKRVLIAVVLLYAVGHGFGLVVEAVNIVGQFLYPEDYRIAVEMDTFEGIATGAFTGVAVLIFAIVASPKILITYGTFLLMLGMRMVIVYSTYVLFPVLIAFWITDIGPMKYGKMLAGKMLQITALLLLFGILLAAILGVGGALSGGGVESSELGGEIGDISFQETGEQDRLTGGVLEDENPQLSAQSQGSLTRAWISVFTYFGALWLCITITSMILGGTVSTGFSGNLMKAKKFEGAKTRMQQRMNSGGNGFGRAEVKGTSTTVNATSNGGGTSTTASTTTSSNTGSESGGNDDAAPQPEDGDEASLMEKFNNVTNDRFKNAKDAGKERAEDVADRASEAGSEYGDSAEESLTDAGERVGDKIGGVGGAAAERAGAAAGKIGNAGITAAGAAPKMGMKGGNLMKRAGSAYASVFKQPDPMSSIGEAARIGRASPIGKPAKPDEGSGETNVEETETGENIDEEDVEDFDVNSGESKESTRDETDDTEHDHDEKTTSNEGASTRRTDDTGDTEDTSKSEESRGESGVSGSGTVDDPVDKLYENSDPSDRYGEQPEVNEDAAEKIAQDIHDTHDDPSEHKVRDEVQDRVDQDLGDSVESMAAEHAVNDKYNEIAGKDSRRGSDDYKWS